MTDRKTYGGSTGTPIEITYPRASAQQQRNTTQEGRSRQQTRKPSVPDDDDENENAWTQAKPHTSAVRYDYPSLSPRNATRDMGNPKRTQLVRQRSPFLARLLIVSGLLLFVVALGIIAFSALGNWWQRHNDDVTYGMPRTFQTDQYVGHGDSFQHPDHFIALNLKGVVEVVEINPQDAQKDHIYYITTTSNALNPVTLTFPTFDGKQYMYVAIGDGDNAYTVALVNDGKEFTGVQH